MKYPIDLVASYWTIAGTLPGTFPEFSCFDFKDRVQAAAHAGFKGMGFWHADLEHLLTRTTLKEMKRILDANGITHIEVEFLVNWFLDGERKTLSDIRKKMLFTCAEALNARYVKVGDFYNEQCTLPRLIESFAILCKEAADFGTRIAFEPMSAAMIHSLEDALAMVAGAGAQNGGLALDLWHIVNQAESYAAVSRIPVQYLFAVDVNDAAILKPGGHNQNAGGPRKFCGEGDFDIRGFINSVKKTGYAGAWGIEVISPELLKMPLEEAATKAFTTTMAQFE